MSGHQCPTRTVYCTELEKNARARNVSDEIVPDPARFPIGHGCALAEKFPPAHLWNGSVHSIYNHARIPVRTKKGKFCILNSIEIHLSTVACSELGTILHGWCVEGQDLRIFLVEDQEVIRRRVQILASSTLTHNYCALGFVYKSTLIRIVQIFLSENCSMVV